MYSLGSQVVYGIHGVCNIVDIERRTVDRKKVEYYVLQPIEQADSRFYVPTQNQAAVAKMRPILSKQEVENLLQGGDVYTQQWIADENQRKQYYRTLICSGDRAALIGMVRLLHIHKNAQQAIGRKFHLSDENFLRDAEKILSGELSLVLGVSRSEVGAYLHTVFDKTV